MYRAPGMHSSGVHTPDECMPGARYIAELEKRGVHIREMKF